MNPRRIVLGVSGVILMGFALLGSGNGPFTSLVDAAVSTLGNDYLLLAVLASGGLAVAAGMVVSGRASNLEQTRMPNPERPVSVHPPGTEFDDRIGSVRFALPVVGRETRDSVRERLRRSAVDVTIRSDGCDRATAEHRVSEGRWTDDDGAAAFLSSSNQSVSPEELLLAGLRTETPSQRRARLAAAEIVARSPERDRGASGGEDG